jgi:hypothetical protein
MRRRDFLSGAAVGVGAGLFIKPAAAFKLESMSAPLEAAYVQSCQIDPTHAALIEEARKKLAYDPQIESKQASAALADLAQELKQALICPLCGCKLALETLPETPAPRF